MFSEWGEHLPSIVKSNTYKDIAEKLTMRANSQYHPVPRPDNKADFLSRQPTTETIEKAIVRRGFG